MAGVGAIHADALPWPALPGDLPRADPAGPAGRTQDGAGVWGMKQQYATSSLPSVPSTA